MKRLLFIVIGTMAIGMCYMVIAAPPVGPPEEAKPVEKLKPVVQPVFTEHGKELAELKQTVAALQERIQVVVDAAKQVSANEHNMRFDQSLNQQVQIKLLEGELAKLRAQSAKN